MSPETKEKLKEELVKIFIAPSCSVCVFCADFPNVEYQGLCRKKGIYLRTIYDRLCEEFELSDVRVEEMHQALTAIIELWEKEGK